MTANDIRDQKFTRIRRAGYRSDEVDAFLQQMTEDYEKLQEQTSEAQNEAARLRVMVHDLQSETTKLRRQQEEAKQPLPPQSEAAGPRSEEMEQMQQQMSELAAQIAALKAQKSDLQPAFREQPDPAQVEQAPDAYVPAEADEVIEEEPDELSGLDGEDGEADDAFDAAEVFLEATEQWEARRQQGKELQQGALADSLALEAMRDLALKVQRQRQQIDHYTGTSIATAACRMREGLKLMEECDQYLLQLQKVRKNVRALTGLISSAASVFQDEANYYMQLSGLGSEDLAQREAEEEAQEQAMRSQMEEEIAQMQTFGSAPEEETASEKIAARKAAPTKADAADPDAPAAKKAAARKKAAAASGEDVPAAEKAAPKKTAAAKAEEKASAAKKTVRKKAAAAKTADTEEASGKKTARKPAAKKKAAKSEEEENAEQSVAAEGDER